MGFSFNAALNFAVLLCLTDEMLAVDPSPHVVLSCATGYTTNVGGDATPMIASSTRTSTRPTSTRPLKILVLTEPSPITYMSGQSLRFYTLLQHLAEEYPMDQVHLITVEKVHPNPPSLCCGGKIPIHYTWGWRPPQYKSLTLSTGISAKAWKFCRTDRPDLLHVSSPGLLLLTAIFTSRVQGIPLVMSYHTHLPVYVRTYMPAPINIMLEWMVWNALRMVHSLADLTVVTSKQMANELTAHGIQNVRIWPKGVNTTKFHPKYKSEDMRYKMSNGNRDDLLLVYIGRLAKEKRLKDIKLILKGLLSKGIPTRLCIVGHGPQEEELKAHFQDTPTIFLASLEGLSLSQAFASADVFVMPSDSETLGFVVMESMASGVPVVACKAGGLMDLIQDGQTGSLVNVGDADAFVDRIETLLTNPTFRKNLVQKARERTEEWSWDASMEYMRQEAYPEAILNFSRRRSKKSCDLSGINHTGTRTRTRT
jgi:sulfoquinovosyltransferase